MSSATESLILRPVSDMVSGVFVHLGISALILNLHDNIIIQECLYYICIKNKLCVKSKNYYYDPRIF